MLKCNNVKMQCQDICKYAMSKAMSEENAHAKCYNATIKCNRVNMQPSNKFKSGPLRSRKYAKNMSKYAKICIAMHHNMHTKMCQMYTVPRAHTVSSGL